MHGILVSFASAAGAGSRELPKVAWMRRHTGGVHPDPDLLSESVLHVLQKYRQLSSDYFMCMELVQHEHWDGQPWPLEGRPGASVQHGGPVLRDCT